MIKPFTKQIKLQDSTISIDWLMYQSYAFNRSRKPEIAPERWRKLYFNAEIYEKIYQEKKNESHA